MSDRRRLASIAGSVLIAAVSLSCVIWQRATPDVTRRVDSALARGDTTGAIKLLESRTKDSDAEPEVYVRLGRLHRSRGSIVGKLCSQRVLEHGLQRFPDDPGVLVELGKTYYAQTFYGDAERVFKRALSMDDGRCEASYYLGRNAYRKWKHVQLYTEYLNTVVSHFRYAIDCDPERPDVCFMLAFSRYVLGDTTFTVKTCDTCRSRHPDDARPLLLLGSIAFEHAQYDLCSSRFEEALAILQDDERMHYRDIDLLISGDEKEEYEAASDEDKEMMARIYWLEHDPDPTTPVNERFLEHVYRMFLADVRFSLDDRGVRGWEVERGKALIKFGWPTHMRTTLEGRRPWDGRMEIWTYLTARRGFTLYFRDEFLNGDYVIPVDHEYSWAAQTLYKDLPLSQMIPESVLIPGVLDVVAFRDSDIAGTVFLMHAVDRDSLTAFLWEWDVDSYVARTAFFDETGQPLYYHADTLNAAAVDKTPSAKDNSLWIVQSFGLPFDSYRVAYCFEDELAVVQSLLWHDTNTIRHLGGSLSLSDILLHDGRVSSSDGPVVVRKGRTFHPNPRREYGASEKLRLYVEVYNLRISGRRTDYAATYAIRPAEPKSNTWRTIGRGIKRLISLDTSADPVISQTIPGTGFEHIAAEELAIDIGSLEPGDYVLTVSVVDKISGESAVVSKAFTKLPATGN